MGQFFSEVSVIDFIEVSPYSKKMTNTEKFCFTSNSVWNETTKSVVEATLASGILKLKNVKNDKGRLIANMSKGWRLTFTVLHKNGFEVTTHLDNELHDSSATTPAKRLYDVLGNISSRIHAQHGLFQDPGIETPAVVTYTDSGSIASRKNYTEGKLNDPNPDTPAHICFPHPNVVITESYRSGQPHDGQDGVPYLIVYRDGKVTAGRRSPGVALSDRILTSEETERLLEKRRKTAIISLCAKTPSVIMLANKVSSHTR